MHIYLNMLVLECQTRFVGIIAATTLSVQMTSLCEKIIPNSENNETSQRISIITWVSALYLYSFMDLGALVCFFELQDNKYLPK